MTNGKSETTVIIHKEMIREVPYGTPCSCGTVQAALGVQTCCGHCGDNLVGVNKSTQRKCRSCQGDGGFWDYDGNGDAYWATCSECDGKGTEDQDG